MFLLAAETFGVAPEACLVLEDSLPGATAGIRAGMRVVGYTGVAHNKADRTSQLAALGVHAVIDDFAALLPLINLV
jgi:beta-phosphoglucomutase-like phosphatase (HAD superfamily)